MANGNSALRASDLGLQNGENEVLDVLDLPQIYTKPSAKVLLATLDDLSSQPPSWETTPRNGTPRSMSGTATPLRKRRKVRSQGVPQYLTKIVSSGLGWIEDDGEKEQIWEAASQRLAERSGRTAMGAISRTFAIPLNPNTPTASTTGVVTTEQALATDVDEDVLEITLHEPALTADNLGLKTWASSYLLAKRLLLLRDTLPELPASVSILELGAGTGLVGLAASAVFKCHTVLTDLPAIVPNLQHNARSNAAVLASHGAGKVDVAVLDWSIPSDYSPTTGNEQGAHLFPLTLAADPVYDFEHPQLLAKAIAHHLSRRQEARVVVEMPLREGFQDVRDGFKDRMTALGLRIAEEGEEVGYDDWGAPADENSDDGNGLTEVRCWWTVWAWR